MEQVLEKKSYLMTEMDLQRLRSFEDALVSSIHAAEETLETAKNRHQVFSKILQKIEEQDN
ncbi:MAG: hypothetical protein OEY94_05660 [Alphaproteobacteria bacterium]|nr:hypothetical protein [Alphaproteobacteria bacterium]